jgi:hypothetical protein
LVFGKHQQQHLQPPLAALCLRSIYEKIGKGKHSTVYKGRKKKTIQYHAIKSVDKSQKPRVLQEVGDGCRLDRAVATHMPPSNAQPGQSTWPLC